MTSLLIDGNNLTMRGIFAMRRVALSAGGVPTGPLLVVINGLAKLVREEQPDRLLVAWDGGVSRQRSKIFPAYKANRLSVTASEVEFRDSTFGMVKEFCLRARVPGFTLNEVEADDIIAAAWGALTPQTEPDKLVIASSDKDFLQLCGPNPHGVPTELVRFSSADTPTDRWDAARVGTDLGYSPEHAPLVMALAGDTVDGVPGVPGIGPKRAVKLLASYDWDLEAALAELARSKPYEAGRVREVYLPLVDLRSPQFPVAIPRWSPTGREDEGFQELLDFVERLELESVRVQLLSGALWRPFGETRALPGRQRQIRARS